MDTNLPLKTTVIGSMAKPAYLTLPCWVNSDGRENLDHVLQLNQWEKEIPKDLQEDQIRKATREALQTQCMLGLNVVTDGEMGRNDYIHPYCRNLTGFDFDNVKEKICRNGKWKGLLPCIVSEINFKDEVDRAITPKEEWQFAQDHCKVPVKYTIPGPLTITDTVVNCYYEDEDTLCERISSLINQTILSLANQGCKHIQIDEPVLARYPHKVESAVKNLERCFEGLQNDVNKIVHICCGYPQYLDQMDYEKADQEAYLNIAEAIDNSTINQISIEDAHRRNSEDLFRKFQQTTVILGVVDVSRSRVESVEEIREHINEILQILPRNRLIIAPDCGLIYLPEHIMKQKLKNMVEAVRTLNSI